MANVRIGSARFDEFGKATGGQAGDQSGKEVSAQNWYLHAKGWVVLRPKDADRAEKIALAMQSACDNPNIGYDQYQRLSLYDAAKQVGFDPGKVTKACETDCSALVRVCCAFAGISTANFNTASQAAALKLTGAFDQLTDAEFTDRQDYLKRGDILVTRSKGHTVVVLTDGDQAAGGGRPTLCAGSKGADVKTLQNLLIAKGYPLPRWGGDGDFGGETEGAVRAYQAAMGLEVDGIAGARTWAALLAIESEKKYRVLIGGLAANVAANLAGEMTAAGFAAKIEEESV